jgi:uncharacterized membrane protein YfcA
LEAIGFGTNLQIPVRNAGAICLVRCFKLINKHQNMKTFGIFLILIGIAMIIVRGISVPTQKKLVDIGPVEINKTENKWIGWPTYSGAVIAVVGVVLVVSGRKRS